MSQSKAKEKRSEKGRLIKEIIAEYEPKTFDELQDILKEIFAPLMEDMLQGELDSHLGYEKHDQGGKETTDRRNGTYDKTVRAKMGEIEVRIPRDRDGELIGVSCM
jgi:transposase-like protein